MATKRSASTASLARVSLRIEDRGWRIEDGGWKTEQLASTAPSTIRDPLSSILYPQYTVWWHALSRMRRACEQTAAGTPFGVPSVVTTSPFGGVFASCWRRLVAGAPVVRLPIFPGW